MAALRRARVAAAVVLLESAGQVSGEADAELVVPLTDQVAGKVKLAAALFGAQLALNLIWSPVFFGARSAGASSTGENEGDHAVTVALTILHAPTLPADVTVDVTDEFTGTAASGTDYTAVGTQTINFAAGNANGATQSATLTPTPDDAIEGDEDVRLSLANATGGATLGAQDRHAATITDAEAGVATVGFSAPTGSADEDVGAHQVGVVLHIGSMTLETDVTVDVTDAGTGSATSGIDHRAVGTQALIFASGSADGATQNTTVTLGADLLVEGDEDLDLALGNMTGPASFGVQTAHELTITDADNATMSFAAATSNVDEDAGAHLIDVTLNTLTFTPDASLGMSTVYTATVAVAATDACGYALAAEFTCSFTTAAPAGNGGGCNVTGTGGNVLAFLVPLGMLCLLKRRRRAVRVAY